MRRIPHDTLRYPRFGLRYLTRAVAAALVAAAWTSAPAADAVRSLSFEQRVAAQEAIERVYHSHLIGAAAPFEVSIPRARLEAKVRRYLQQSAALERFWGTPVTSEMLRRELERMAAGSRMPERLLELHAALGNDALLISESLARPVLVDRLSRGFYAFDERFHEEALARAERLHEDLLSGALDARAPHPVKSASRSGAQGASSPAQDLAPAGAQPSAALGLRRSYPLADAGTGGSMERRTPRGDGLSPLREDEEAYSFTVMLDREGGSTEVAEYRVAKRTYDEWWSAVALELPESVPTVGIGSDLAPAPSPSPSPPGGTGCFPERWDGTVRGGATSRYRHTAVWTGSVMIVWGGYDGFYTNTGARYDPATDTWSSTSTVGAPSARYQHTAVWTGSRMVVWGGFVADPLMGTIYMNSGGRYDPIADTWTPTSSQGAPQPRAQHTAVWTGSRMIVWGGRGYTAAMAGGALYDPSSDTWAPVASQGAPSARYEHTAVWTGSLMIVWGGLGPSLTALESGGRYDPAANRWTSVTPAGAPSGRGFHSAVWTGSRMIVWGGRDELLSIFNTGGRYDPAADRWFPTSISGAPAGRSYHTAVWTGSLMLVWGGASDSGVLGTGGSYDPTTDIWSNLSHAGATNARSHHSAIWTGTRMIVWGGWDFLVFFGTGGRYDPTTSSWTPTSTLGAPSPRWNHTAVWTGAELIVWGGAGFDAEGGIRHFNTGSRYNPATDSWVATTTRGVPAARDRHTAVWTGSEMIVWGGGSGSSRFGDGGRYQPQSDTWQPLAMDGAPSPRLSHAAVWTGTAMIVWGGNGGPNLDTGGRYYAGSNTWKRTTPVGAPPGRYGHTAVWSGNELIVWGGYDVSPLGGGGRYDPVADTWRPISTLGSPSARFHHSAVWTGGEMIVWGGLRPAETGTGGRYHPGTDSWTPISTINAPQARALHSALWTGTSMLVWGGRGSFTYLRTGGVYDPVTDLWKPTSVESAPPARAAHAAVWAGDRMLVWGGLSNPTTPLDSGGAYDSGSEGARCDDGNACTTDDACSAGRCVGGPSLACNDGNPCTDDACHPAIGCLQFNNAAACSDGNPCTTNDRCFGGVCTGGAAPPPPGTITGVVASSKTIFRWTPLAAMGAAYDVVRGRVGVWPVDGGVLMQTCLKNNAPGASVSDLEVPAAQSGYWYLVRGRDGCGGIGTYGWRSSGLARLTTACP